MLCIIVIFACEIFSNRDVGLDPLLPVTIALATISHVVRMSVLGYRG